MTARWPYEEAHERAWQLFHALGPEARLARMRQAGVIGLTPQLGDKVRVAGPLNDYRYGIVVGERRGDEPRVFVAHKSPSAPLGVTPLSAFANGYGVGLIQRAAPGTELHVVLRALKLLGSDDDLEAFDVEHVGQEPDAELTVRALLAELGLEAQRVVLSGEHEWDEPRARYREARHKVGR